MNIKKFILSFFVLIMLLVTISSVFAQASAIKPDALIEGYHKDLFTFMLHNTYDPAKTLFGSLGITSLNDFGLIDGKALKFSGFPAWKIRNNNGALVFSDFLYNKNVLSLSQTGDVVVDLSS